ncbi:MAG: helix-turn-helix domain containing protein, partial [Reyranella sp.]|nr:helix-turn-helix domain containing protein [Reyranella sp.]
CPAEPLPAALAKALANPRRVDTPVRQRTAFLRHLRQCGTVAEAAARAGVNRGSLYRWRAKDPDFAARWAAAIARHADEVGDDIVLQANQVEIQPVFYRGQKIGERRRVNTRLMIHVQNRLDAERRRAEDRAERRELLLLRAELAERSLKIRQPATPATVPPAVEMSCGDLGLAAAA